MPMRKEAEEMRKLQRFYSEILITSLKDLHGSVGNDRPQCRRLCGKYYEGKKFQWWREKLRNEALMFFDERNKMFELTAVALGIEPSRLKSFALGSDEDEIRRVIKEIKEAFRG